MNPVSFYYFDIFDSSSVSGQSSKKYEVFEQTFTKYPCIEIHIM